jgi:hypothetical protein
MASDARAQLAAQQQDSAAAVAARASKAHADQEGAGFYRRVARSAQAAVQIGALLDSFA